MSNYNSTLQSNNTDLQTVLQALQSKAAAGQATPVISVSSNGLITATAGTKSATKQLAFQAAKTITPSTASQIAVSSGYYTGGDITVAAVPTQSKTVTPTSTTQNITPDSGKFLSKVTVNGDSDLVAGNIKSGVNIFGVTGTYVGSGGGDTRGEDGIIDRTISGTYMNDRITTIGSYAFQYCSSLTSVSFPNAKTIGSYAFQYCSSLTSVSFPNAKTIDNYAFDHCSRLTSVSFPNATTIGSYAFQYCSSLTSVSFPNVTNIGVTAFQHCSSLTSVSFPNVTTIGDHAFQDCSRLTSVSFPNATTIGSYAFQHCSSLTSVSFPNVTTIGSYAFRDCSRLTSVSFPNAKTIGNYAFDHCSSLTSVSFPNVTTIGGYAFQYCRRLSQIYLMASSVCRLAASTAFSGTNIWSTKGSIFVPSSLVASYKAATNWVFFSKRIYSA